MGAIVVPHTIVAKHSVMCQPKNSVNDQHPTKVEPKKVLWKSNRLVQLQKKQAKKKPKKQSKSGPLKSDPLKSDPLKKRKQQNLTCNSKCTCNHKICQDAIMHYGDKNFGVGTAIVDGKKVLVGLETRGKKRNKINICTGTRENKDKNCILATAIRELKEEYMLEFDIQDFIDHIKHVFYDDNFKNNLIIGGTLILVHIGFGKPDINELNNVLHSRNSNLREENEVSELQLINYFEKQYTNQSNKQVAFIGRQVFKKLQLIYSSRSI